MLVSQLDPPVADEGGELVDLVGAHGHLVVDVAALEDERGIIF